jgi:hypothetical protein
LLPALDSHESVPLLHQTEIQDAYRTEERKARTLRLVVFNTASPGGGTPSDPPHWTLCLHGQLADCAPGQDRL